MIYIFISVLIVLGITLLIFPFKIHVYNNDNYLYINIGKLLNLKLNLLAVFDKKQKKKKTEFSKIKKFKFKEINLKIQGLNFDYRLNGAYFGLIYALSGFFKNIGKMNDIKFNYEFNYLGDKSIEFNSIFRARMMTIIDIFNGV